MENTKELLLKLNNGGRTLNDEEAELLMEILQGNLIKKGQNFEKRGSMRESLSLASDSCSHCGRSY